MDIFVDVPTLLEDLDNAKSCHDAGARLTQLKEVRDKCWHIHGRLTLWWSDTQLPDPLDLAMDQVCSVEHLMAVYIACIFWAISILVYSTLHIVHAQSPSLLTESPPPQLEPRKYCLKIAQALPLFLSGDSGEFGKHMIIYPTAVALRWLYATDEVDVVSTERKMILGAFDDSGSGAYINGFRDSCQRNSAHGETLKLLEGIEAVRKRGRMWLGMDW
jgi:hypothetical protein